MVVGYGTDLNTMQDYWIIQNSWGVGWVTIYLIILYLPNVFGTLIFYDIKGDRWFHAAEEEPYKYAQYPSIT